MPFHVAFVQTETKLVNIAGNMLRTCVVVNAMQPSPKYRENAFHSVRSNSLARVFTLAVLSREKERKMKTINPNDLLIMLRDILLERPNLAFWQARSKSLPFPSKQLDQPTPSEHDNPQTA
jgi:hypothetical protein